MYVTAILSGPGHLLYRTGSARGSATWLRQAHHPHRAVVAATIPAASPIERIADIGVTVDLAVDADDARDVRRRALDPRPHHRPHPGEPSRCG